jgi:exosortase
MGLLVCAAAVAVTSDAWRDLVYVAARDEEASHAFLVPAVAIWLAWVRMRRLRHCMITGTWVGVVMIAAGWLAHWAGDRWLWQSVWHGGAVMVLVGCIVTVTGAAVLRDFLPAFVALLFMIPVPGRIRQEIAVPLQTVTAWITHQAFDVFGAAVQRSGNMLSINGVDVAIIEACNGLRMVFALTLVSYAFAFSSPLRPYVRAVVIGGSPLMAVLCNVVRLVPTVWIYGHFSSRAGDRFHSLAGWVMLFAAFFMLVGLIRFLRWAMAPVTHYVLAYD